MATVEFRYIVSSSIKLRRPVGWGEAGGQYSIQWSVFDSVGQYSIQ